MRAQTDTHGLLTIFTEFVYHFNDAVKIRRECDRIRKINDGLRNEIEERLRFQKL